MATRTIHSVVFGQAVPGTSDRPDVNPSDLTDVVLAASMADAELARRAVASAAEAFTGWSRTTPWQRAEVLDRAGSEVIARADELGDLLAREEGKTLPEARGEVVRAGQILKYFAGVALQPHGQAVDSVRPGIEITVTREPIGVVSVITPWNFPVAIPTWKIAPALAFGNTVVFKPADLVPGSAWELVDILNRAGLPPGGLNLVLGRGSSGRFSPASQTWRGFLSPDQFPPATGSWSTLQRVMRRCSSNSVARTRWSSAMTPTSRSPSRWR